MITKQILYIFELVYIMTHAFVKSNDCITPAAEQTILICIHKNIFSERHSNLCQDYDAQILCPFVALLS